MPTRELMSVREYLSTSFPPDCDYVDGEVVARNLGCTTEGLLETQELRTENPDILIPLAALFE